MLPLVAKPHVRGAFLIINKISCIDKWWSYFLTKGEAMTVSLLKSNICKFGGFNHSCTFNFDKEWLNAGVFPFANTVSGSIRLVGNVAFAVINTVRIPCSIVGGVGQWAFSKETTCFEITCDSTRALGLNIFASAYAVFEAVPIVGNTPYWLCNFAISKVEY